MSDDGITKWLAKERPLLTQTVAGIRLAGVLYGRIGLSTSGVYTCFPTSVLLNEAKAKDGNGFFVHRPKNGTNS